MIKNLFQGIGIEVAGGGSQYPYINMSNPNAGKVQFNGTTFDVYDGTNWLNISGSSATISLDKETLDILDWVKRKRDDELMLEERAKSNPALADLLNQRKELEEKIKILEILSR